MSPETFVVQVRLFATLKELAGDDVVSIAIETNTTVDDLRQQLLNHHPQLSPALPSAIAAINQEYVFADHVIRPDDEIAFFPPVSGGSYPEIFLLSETLIDLNDLTQKIVTSATGAIAIFSGYVRGETTSDHGARKTVRLEYEAYAPMAYTKMKQVATEIRKQWPRVQGIAIVQRIGTLSVGEPTVLIACAAGHRDHGCFEAARYGIDRLKEIVPIWKKEYGPAGEHWVEGHYHPTPDDQAP